MKFLKIDKGYFWPVTDEEIIDPQFNPKWVLIAFNGISYILKLIAHGPNHIRAVPYNICHRNTTVDQRGSKYVYYIRLNRVTNKKICDGIIGEWERLVNV